PAVALPRRGSPAAAECARRVPVQEGIRRGNSPPPKRREGPTTAGARLRTPETSRLVQACLPPPQTGSIPPRSSYLMGSIGSTGRELETGKAGDTVWGRRVISEYQTGRSLSKSSRMVALMYSMGIARQTPRTKLRDLGLHAAHPVGANEDDPP